MSVIGPRPGLWNQDILTAERDKYNATVEGAINFLTKIQKEWMERRIKKQISAKRCGFILIREDTLPMYLLAFKRCQ